MKKVLGILTLFCLIVCGCSSKPSPSVVTKTFIDGIKTEAQIESLGLLNGSSDSFSDEFAKVLLESMVDFDYKINGETIEGDKATVNITISSYDFEEFIKGFLTDYFQQALALAFTGASEAELEELGNDIAQKKLDEIKELGKTKNTDVDLALKTVDGEWVFDEEANEDALADAVTGGMLSAAQEISDSLSDFSLE